MRILATRHALQTALAQVVPVVASRTTVPVLGHVLIEAGDGLTITGTDLDRVVRVRAHAEVEEPGSFTLPAKTFADLVKSLPEKPIHIQSAGKQITVSSGRTVARLHTYTADEWPPMPEVEAEGGVEIDAGALAEMIQRTVFAASDEVSRPILNGALLHADDGRLRMVATNGHRLAAVYGPEAPEGLEPVILPATGLATVERMLRSVEGAVRIAPGKGYAAITAEGVEFQMRLIEGPYPNYQQVIPREHPTTAVVDREAFLAAIRRAAVLASEQSRRTVFEWGAEGVQISVSTPDTGGMDEMVEAAVDGPELRTAFNADYLAEIMGRIAMDEVEVRLGTPERAAIIAPVGDDDALYLCMPLRLLD